MVKFIVLFVYLKLCFIGNSFHVVYHIESKGKTSSKHIWNGSMKIKISMTNIGNEKDDYQMAL